MSLKEELDKELKSILLKKEGKHPDQIARKISIKEGFDKEAIEIRNQVSEDNIVVKLKEIFDWYASVSNVSFKYKYGIASAWGDYELSLKHFPLESNRKVFRFYVIKNFWFRPFFRKRYWILIELWGRRTYNKYLTYSVYSSDRCIDPRWRPGDDTNIHDFEKKEEFIDTSSLLEFLKTRLIHKLTSPSLKKIYLSDTYPIRKDDYFETN